MTLGNLGVALAIAVAVAAAASLKTKAGRWLSPLVLLAALVVPLGDLTLAALARGVIGEMSVTSMVLLFVCFAGFAPGMELPRRERLAVFACVVPSGLLLYPMALGLTPFDPYALGFGSRSLLLGLALLGVAAALAGYRLLPAIVAGSLGAFAFELLESTNLWDYWIDPWIFFFSLFAVARAQRDALRRK